MTDQPKDPKIPLTEAVVLAASGLGVQVVREMIVGALQERPHLTLREFQLILDQYEAKMEQQEFNINAKRH